MQFSCSISAKKYYFRKFPRTLRRMIVVLDREILDRRKYPLENKSKARAETSSAIKEILQQIIDDEREGEGGGVEIAFQTRESQSAVGCHFVQIGKAKRTNEFRINFEQQIESTFKPVNRVLYLFFV